MRTPLSLAVLLLAAGTLAPASLTLAEALQLESGTRQNTLIELYTSQGCSSCPPAERWLGRLKDDPRLWTSLVPVAFHVDYWDYIGWKDRLAEPAYAARQRRYRREQTLSAVYTPGFVVNGMEWRRWFGTGELPRSERQSGRLSVRIEQRRLSAAFHPIDEGMKGPFVLNVALLGTGISVEVKRGENAGKRLPQEFVVLKLMTQHAPQPRWRLPLPAVEKPPAARLAIAVWVSRRGSLTPLQAVGGWLETGPQPAIGESAASTSD